MQLTLWGALHRLKEEKVQKVILRWNVLKHVLWHECPCLLESRRLVINASFCVNSYIRKFFHVSSATCHIHLMLLNSAETWNLLYANREILKQGHHLFYHCPLRWPLQQSTPPLFTTLTQRTFSWWWVIMLFYSAYQDTDYFVSNCQSQLRLSLPLDYNCY